ncbi:putative RDD family membrane protein YckC [Chryseobacterium defluvii]|uniref:Putative RDD family membrane protein YckC n=1 Tax=Chryseobacterium defluvii TaxID=160396 RepID=A0A840KEE1_9FLAO|nr:RDD family protein [Chryseobacterium defluvii]MBB4806358.1 putative RDD family membrane protein YckC [Chryseobacterium defluvii]
MRKVLKIVEYNKSPISIRFANLVIDRIVVFTLFVLFGLFSSLAYQFFNIEFFLNIANKLSDINKIQDLLITSFLYFLYVFLMEYFIKGRTIGKYITGTKVISTDGSQPTLLEYFIRNISRFVPFDALSFFGENGWHDNWSDTRVVNIKNYESKKQLKEEINSLGTKEIA